MRGPASPSFLDCNAANLQICEPKCFSAFILFSAIMQPAWQELLAESFLDEIDLEWEEREEEREEHRLQGYFAVLRSDEYLYVRCFLPWMLMPQGPCPGDRTLGKRPWEKAMQAWRHQLKYAYNWFKSLE